MMFVAIKLAYWSLHHLVLWLVATTISSVFYF